MTASATLSWSGIYRQRPGPCCCAGAKAEAKKTGTRTAFRLHIHFNVWLGVINTPCQQNKAPGITESARLTELNSFQGERLKIAALPHSNSSNAPSKVQICHSAPSRLRNTGPNAALSWCH